MATGYPITVYLNPKLQHILIGMSNSESLATLRIGEVMKQGALQNHWSKVSLPLSNKNENSHEQ